MYPFRVNLISNPLVAPYLRFGEDSNYTIKAMRAFVVHWTANEHPKADADRHRTYFQNLKDRKASCHYMIDENGVLQIMPQNKVAFHCGDKAHKPTPKSKWTYADLGKKLMKGFATPNFVANGTELCVNAGGDFSKTEQHAVKHFAYLLHAWRDHNPALLRHRDITGKLCPRMYLDEQEWTRFKNMVNAELVKLFLLQSFEVITAQLNVRSGPGVSFPVLYTLQHGERGNIHSIGPDWVQIGEGQWINKKVTRVF
jgi:N-acetylmuramoyl-L-alanine amidase CwlA